MFATLSNCRGLIYIYMGEGGRLCIKFKDPVHTFDKKRNGEILMKMTKEEAQNLAKRCIEHSKKYGIPLKNKKKKAQ